MAKKIKDNPQDYPWLGRVFNWVDRPGSVSRLIWGLALACLLLVLADFTYDKYGNFAVDYVPGFYGLFGFVMFTGVVLGAKALRVLIKRREDYYAPHAVNSEDYPDDELEKVSHDAD